MHKDKDFPKIGKSTSLNKGELAGARIPDPQPDAGTDKQPKIKEVAAFINLRYDLRYNVVKNEIEFRRKTSGGWQDCDERAALRFEAELLEAGYSGIGRVLTVFLANVPEHDPVAEYLDRLPPWDGKEHIQHLASFVLMREARRVWFLKMFKKHLCRLVACASGEVPFNKQIFVFCSNQNDGKTTFTRFLCPEDWKAYFSEEVDFESKDGLIALSRNIFLNLDELRGMSRADINRIKAFTTKEFIKARLPFDRRETRLRRRATFFASTNNSEFLTDETGNVRWLVFEVDGFKHDNGGPDGYGWNVNIQQVYAQVKHLLKTGVEIHLTRDEIEYLEKLNQAHTKKSLEYEAILLHLEPSTEKVDFLTATQIKNILEGAPHFCKISSTESIGKALRQMGVERLKARVDGNAIFGYLLKTRTASGVQHDAD